MAQADRLRRGCRRSACAACASCCSRLARRRAPALPLALVLLVHCLAMLASGLITYSPYLTHDARFPARPGVYRADTELLADAPCSSASPCCRQGSELVIETRYYGKPPRPLRAATCQQCLPGWFAERRMRLEFDASYDAFSRDRPACTRCPHGKYGTDAPRKSCSDCPAEEHTDQHTRLARRDCLGCAAGEYYAWKEGCFGCWPNYFCPNGHDLALCPGGTKSEARQTQCAKVPRVTLDTVVNPPPSAATPCTSQQQRADLGCRTVTNRYTCDASTSNVKVVLTSATDDHRSETSELQIGCLWCPAFNDSGVVADRCLARTFCKAAVGLSSCWDGTSAAPSARRASPAALALALAMTLGSAGRLTWQGLQWW